MKLFRSPNPRQPTNHLTDRAASTRFEAAYVGAPWQTLSLDDFGIIGSHHLPVDWIGSDGEQLEPGVDRAAQ